MQFVCVCVCGRRHCRSPWCQTQGTYPTLAEHMPATRPGQPPANAAISELVPNLLVFVFREQIFGPKLTNIGRFGQAFGRYQTRSTNMCDKHGPNMADVGQAGPTFRNHNTCLIWCPGRGAANTMIRRLGLAKAGERPKSFVATRPQKQARARHRHSDRRQAQHPNRRRLVRGAKSSSEFRGQSSMWQFRLLSRTGGG